MKSATILAGALAGMIAATPAGGQVMVLDAGRASCGSWLEFRANESNPQDVRHHQAKEWMAGYLTAYNWYLHPYGDVVGSVDRQGLYAWLDNYCRENPTTAFAFAVNNLIVHLEGGKRREAVR